METTEQVPNPRAGEAGFTLIEALVAILVLVFGLMGIANLYLIASSSNQASSQGTAAANLAAARMETFKGADFADISVGNGLNATGPCGGTAFCQEDDVQGVGHFITRWRVEQVDNLTFYMRVRSEATGLLNQRTRSELTSFRVCSGSPSCPANP